MEEIIIRVALDQDNEGYGFSVYAGGDAYEAGEAAEQAIELLQRGE